MMDQKSEHWQKWLTCCLGRNGLDIFCLIALLVLALLLVACSSPLTTSPKVTLQAALPTPTSEPTFTPSPPPTDTPIATPTDTPPPELTPTPAPRAGVSGRISDQSTNQPIAEAEVSVGGQTTTTNTNGRYMLTGLEPGQYILSVTHPEYDPGLSKIFTLARGQDFLLDLTLYAPDTSPYPQDPMLTNPLDPNGAWTEADAIRLAQEQRLTGEVVGIKETTLTGEYLVNYRIGDEIRAAVAELKHEAWELTDQAGRKWWIIKVCGNLASPLPAQKLIPTPSKPTSLPPMAEVVDDMLTVRACTSDECAEVGTVSRGERVEVFGCLADNSWCEVSWSGGRGWCAGQSLRQLTVPEVMLVVEAVIPTPTPGVVASREGKIVFQRPGAIYVIDADGSGLVRLADDGLTPAWSPDGQRIVFSRNGDIYVMNADGSDQTNLTNNPDLHFYLDPTWSPDGQQILFTSSGDPNYPAGRLLVINDDGSGLRDLVEPSLFPGLAVWSPDGKRIAFIGNGSLQVINTDGTNLTRLTDGGGTPDWSSDGQKIVFSANPPGEGINVEIFVINADGSGLIRLTNHPAKDTWPAWSPDGRQIVFRSTRDGDHYIYVMNADGSDLTRLTPGNNPDW